LVEAAKVFFVLTWPRERDGAERKPESFGVTLNEGHGDLVDRDVRGGLVVRGQQSHRFDA
jgi:hypothetical protein